MQQTILAQGMFTLTQEAADAALDAIDFIAAAVRGYDNIEVTNVVRPIWRAHLAYWYPHLAPPTQQWFANAPQLLAFIHAQWPVLDPWRRAAILQQWALELPQMLTMVDPVLAQAQAAQSQSALHAHLEELRRMAASGRASAPSDELQAVEQLNTNAQISTSLERFSTVMTNNTIGLMHAMNRK